VSLVPVFKFVETISFWDSLLQFGSLDIAFDRTLEQLKGSWQIRNQTVGI
jgi:hypothetical protein